MGDDTRRPRVRILPAFSVEFKVPRTREEKKGGKVAMGDDTMRRFHAYMSEHNIRTLRGGHFGPGSNALFWVYAPDIPMVREWLSREGLEVVDEDAEV